MNRHRIVAIVFLIISVTTVLIVRELNRRWRDSSPTVVEIPITTNRVQPKVAFVWDVAFLLAPDGSLWGWGNNERFGSLVRDAARERWLRPAQLGTNSDWIDLAVIHNEVVLLRRDGRLWAWDASRTNGSPGYPRQFETNAGWRSIHNGLSHVLALREDGSLWAWGQNNSGQLGDGTTVSCFAPVPVGTNRNWSALAPGAFHNLALQSNGTLWCWGRIDPAQPSAGVPRNTLFPTQFGDETNWIHVASGDYHCIAQKSDGSLWLWGPNANAVMAGGSTNMSNGLIRLNLVGDVRKLAGFGLRCLALRRDGTLWGWGRDYDGGPLENSTRARESVRIGGRRDWIDLWSGGEASVALAADGTLWTWGVKLGYPTKLGFFQRIEQWIGRLRGVFGNRAVANRSLSGSPQYAVTPWPIARFITNNMTPTGQGPSNRE